MELIYWTIGTLTGVSFLLVALGLSLNMRPWPRQPWVRPWLASYWIAALSMIGLALNGLVPASSRPPAFALAIALFLGGSGFQALGWLRMSRPAAPTALAFLPALLYGVLMFPLHTLENLGTRVALFSGLQTILHIGMAIWAFQGLRTRRLRGVTTGLLVAHGLFNALRALHALSGFPSGDLFLSILLAMGEGLAFLLLLAYLQWLLLSEEAEA